MIEPKYRNCHFYEEDNDMGAIIPLCRVCEPTRHPPCGATCEKYLPTEEADKILLKCMESSRKALTLEDLLGMDGEPVYVTSYLGEQPMWYIVDVEENELKNPWDRITLEGWGGGCPYRAYRCPPKFWEV